MPKIPSDISEQDGMCAILSIPNHKILAKGTLRSLIRHANLNVEEFLKLLK